MALQRSTDSVMINNNTIIWPTAETIKDWLADKIAENLNTSQEAIGIDTPFYELGLVSVDAEVLVGELEQWLGKELSATMLWSYPTIEDLAEFLAAEMPRLDQLTTMATARAS